ncbi:MAG: hypothetical protein E6Q32_08645 [Neisseriales bacterium]|jgi:hypothetical protein|nr:MAG: hypothetical protein E6Q32_08645 [Neisseriales bacterium]
MKKLIVSLLATVSFQAVAYEKILAYECQSTARVGFVYDAAQGWIPNITKFKPVIYKIFATPTRKNNKYELQLGDKATLSDIDCDDFSPNGLLYCDIGLGGHFKLNKANLRFIHSFDHGYFNVGVPNQKLALHPTTDAESLSPTQQIGLCVKK